MQVPSKSRSLKARGLSEDGAIRLAKAFSQDAGELPSVSAMNVELGYYVLDENHQLVPATLPEWGQMMEDPDSRRVGRTEVMVDGHEVVVSTVFLGVDHGFLGKREFFETMTFGEPFDQINVARYETWDEAQRGHDVAVDRLRKGFPPAP